MQFPACIFYVVQIPIVFMQLQLWKAVSATKVHIQFLTYQSFSITHSQVLTILESHINNSEKISDLNALPNLPLFYPFFDPEIIFSVSMSRVPLHSYSSVSAINFNNSQDSYPYQTFIYTLPSYNP